MPPYSPWTWLEKITQVGPTRMNAIETGLADASAVAYAAVPKSVAVADQDLIIGTGSGTVGRKAKGADGSWLRMAGGALVWDTIDPQDISGYPADATKYLAGDATWKTIGTIGYGTALPGSPVDGQEYILVNSTTNPIYEWRFRYNNGSSSAYKWEFVGGIPLRVQDTDQKDRTSATIGDPITGAAGPSLTLPRAGDYDIEISCDYFLKSAGAAAAAVYAIDSVGTQNLLVQSNSLYYVPLARHLPLIGVPSGTLKLQYQSDGGNVAYWNMPVLSVWPRRVS